MLFRRIKSSVQTLYPRGAGFTFVELLLAVSILAVIVVGIEEMFIMASVLGDISTNTSKAIVEARNKLQEIQNTNFDQIVTKYSQGGDIGNTFDLINLRGKGVVTIDQTNPVLLIITIDVSYMNKNNRVVGEDQNLDGILEGGEDVNNNNKLDSVATLTTYIAKR